jgi:hypothetical protein
MQGREEQHDDEQCGESRDTKPLQANRERGGSPHGPELEDGEERLVDAEDGGRGEVDGDLARTRQRSGKGEHGCPQGNGGDGIPGRQDHGIEDRASRPGRSRRPGTHLSSDDG